MNRKTKLQLGSFAIVLASVVGFYQYRLNEYKNITSTTCYQIKKGITVIKGQELKEDMFIPKKDSRANLPDDYIKTLNGIDKKVAAENMYDGDTLRSKKVIDKSKWYKEDDKIIWLTSKQDDLIAGNDLRPGDKIDLFYYDPEQKAYINDPRYEGLEIIDLKDKNGIKYFDNHSSVFVINSICFRMDNARYGNLTSKLKAQNSDFKISIHGNRPNVERIIKEDASVVQSLTK